MKLPRKWLNYCLLTAGGYFAYRLFTANSNDTGTPGGPQPTDSTVWPFNMLINNQFQSMINRDLHKYSLLYYAPGFNKKDYIIHFTASELASKKGGLPEDRELWPHILPALAFANDVRILSGCPVTITPGGLFGGKHVTNSQHYIFAAIDITTSPYHALNAAIVLADAWTPTWNHNGFGTYSANFVHFDSGIGYNQIRRWHGNNQAYDHGFSSPWHDPKWITTYRSKLLTFI